MKRFKFRLQRVMDAKLSEERLRQRELGEALAYLQEQEAKLTQLEEELAEEERQQRERIKGAMRAGDALLQHSWYRELRTRIRQQGEELNKAAVKVEESRQRLVEVSKDKKVLERLKEKRQEEHRKATLTETQAMLDDVGARQRSVNGNQAG